MLEVEATGKNLEQAIENALFELKAPREDVDIKILDEGGFFRKAKVRVSISPDEIEKYQKREKRLEDEQSLQDNEQEDVGDVEENNPSNEEIEDEKQNEETRTEELSQLNTVKKQTNKSELSVAKDFLDGLIKMASLNGSVELYEEDDAIYANIAGFSDVIGYRGEGLNALQYLSTVVASKHNRHAKPIRIDCDGYRKRRESSLVALAQRMARKVERTHSSVKLEPMTPQERRIIHMALADNENIETLSKGEEPHRYLIIRSKND